MHPFERLSAQQHQRFYWILLIATFVVMFILQYFGQGFESRTNADGESFNILHLEFAHTPDRVEVIKDAWGPEGIQAAKLQTYADFLFLVFYSCTIALGVLAVVSGLPEGSKWLAIGRLLAWLQPLAGLLDAIENVAMLISLGGPASAPMPQVAYYCATVKFIIVIAGILFVFAALPLRVTDRD